MDANSGIGRRALALLVPAALAACGDGGPPDRGDVRGAVVARLEELRRRFLDGDTGAVPEDVAERTLFVKLKQADLNAASEGAAVRIVEGTARSMGIDVTD